MLDPHLETPPGWLLSAQPAWLVCAWLLRSTLCVDLPCPTVPGYTLSVWCSTRQTEITNNQAFDQGSHNCDLCPNLVGKSHCNKRCNNSWQQDGIVHAQVFKPLPHDPVGLLLVLHRVACLAIQERLVGRRLLSSALLPVLYCTMKAGKQVLSPDCPTSSIVCTAVSQSLQAHHSQLSADTPKHAGNFCEQICNITQLADP